MVWVITEPTNLYDQAQWPNVDYLLSFHVGLGLRLHGRNQRAPDPRSDDHGITPVRAGRIP